MTDKEKARLEFARTHKHENGYTQWGNNLVKHPGTYSIGEDGFGWVRDENGDLVKMPHAGNVVFGDNVELGRFVNIDRAVVGSTVIGDNTKIDSFVHVGHGAKIGKRCILTAGCIIGGSVEIGNDCYIGLGALIKNKVKIGNNVTIGMGSVVLKDVPDNSVVYGNPARTKEEHENRKH